MEDNFQNKLYYYYRQTLYYLLILFTPFTYFENMIGNFIHKIDQYHLEDFSFKLFNEKYVVGELFNAALLGRLFVVGTYSFIFILTKTFFWKILPIYYDLFGFVNVIPMTLIACYILVNSVFNFTLAVIVKPGSYKDFLNSKFYKKNDPYKLHPDCPDLNCLLQNPKNKINTKVRNQFCKTCKINKALRMHHCSTCNVCIFKMDHHCYWINNCIGLYNHKYFIYFLLHMLIGTIYIYIIYFPFLVGLMENPNDDLSLALSVNTVSTALLLYFNIWNWHIILQGNTLIEYWKNRSGENNSIITDFGFRNRVDNLYFVFGTKNILKAIFCLSIKRIPLSGLEWTQLEYDKNFKFDVSEDDMPLDSKLSSLHENVK